MAKLLIVDNHAERVKGLTRLLDFALHTYKVVPSGTAAFDYLQTVTELPEGIIANTILEGIDGFHLCRTLKQTPEWAKLAVILIGEQHHDPRDESLARRAGCSAFIRRPIQRDTFLADIDQALLLAPVQDNPFARANPQEEVIFLRDYNAWLSTMLYRSSHLLEQTVEDLEVRDAHVYAMKTLTTALGSNLDFSATAQTLVTKAAEILRAQAAAIYTYYEQEDIFRLANVASFGIPTPHVPPTYQLDEDSPIWRVAGRDKALLFTHPQENAALQTAFQLQYLPASTIISPLITQGEFSGFLLVLRMDTSDLFTHHDADSLFSLGGAAGLALRSAELFSDLEQAYDDLKELDRRKSEFVAITSHELRTPIAIMLGYASLLHDMETNAQKKAQLATIEKQANFLTGMVDALLNLHELSLKDDPIKLRCSQIRVDELLQEAVKVTQEQNLLRKAVNFRIDCDPITIEGDEIRLLLALNNLFENAVKFSEEGSNVEVIVAERLEGGAIITIQDHGIGIPEEFFERIFEPFFQVEAAMTRHHGGLGLGLAIVKGMIDLHLGQIEVKSKVGQGTRFIITLPAELPPERCLSASGGF